MSQHVTVVPSDRLILVDGLPLQFDFAAPAGLHALQWHDGSGHLEFTDGTPNRPLAEADYEAEVAPFAALWETEKARLDAEAAAAEVEFTSLENVRARKLAALNADFAAASASGSLVSALGFPIDATERANRDIAGLITSLEASGAETVMFCDHDNVMRSVTLADLKAMQLEIIVYGQSLYARKWALREKITSAATAEAIEAVAWDTELNESPARNVGGEAGA